MSDDDIPHLIAGIEQLSERGDTDGIAQRVSDFAESPITPVYKVATARQEIAQRLRPEFGSDELEPARSRNEGLRLAMDILWAAQVAREQQGGAQIGSG